MDGKQEEQGDTQRQGELHVVSKSKRGRPRGSLSRGRGNAPNRASAPNGVSRGMGRGSRGRRPSNDINSRIKSYELEARSTPPVPSLIPITTFRPIRCYGSSMNRPQIPIIPMQPQFVPRTKPSTPSLHPWEVFITQHSYRSKPLSQFPSATIHQGQIHQQLRDISNDVEIRLQNDAGGKGEIISAAFLIERLQNTEKDKDKGQEEHAESRAIESHHETLKQADPLQKQLQDYYHKSLPYQKQKVGKKIINVQEVIKQMAVKEEIVQNQQGQGQTQFSSHEPSSKRLQSTQGKDKENENFNGNNGIVSNFENQHIMKNEETVDGPFMKTYKAALAEGASFWTTGKQPKLENSATVQPDKEFEKIEHSQLNRKSLSFAGIFGVPKLYAAITATIESELAKNPSSEIESFRFQQIPQVPKLGQTTADRIPSTMETAQIPIIQSDQNIAIIPESQPMIEGFNQHESDVIYCLTEGARRRTLSGQSGCGPIPVKEMNYYKKIEQYLSDVSNYEMD